MLEFGKKIYPKKVSKVVEKGATRIKGPYWSIELEDDEYVFRYASGSHGGGAERAVVTKADFDAVHADQMTSVDVMRKYGLS